MPLGFCGQIVLSVFLVSKYVGGPLYMFMTSEIQLALQPMPIYQNQNIFLNKYEPYLIAHYIFPSDALRTELLLFTLV